MSEGEGPGFVVRDKRGQGVEEPSATPDSQAAANSQAPPSSQQATPAFNIFFLYFLVGHVSAYVDGRVCGPGSIYPSRESSTGQRND